jgi:peroxiredoxin
MEETLQQPPTLARSPQGRRSKLAPAHIALLLALPAVGLGWGAWTAILHGPLIDAQGDVAPAADDFRPTDQDAALSGSLQEVLAHADLIPSHHHPLLGLQAPDFELADSEGNTWNLSELRTGAPVVLIFYYGFHCNHCVRQLFDVNRDLPLFRELGARVVAISADPAELTRQRYRQYGSFAFPVLSDPGNKVAHAYQVFRADLLRHGTFVIGRDGTVQWVNVGDAPFRRNSALLYQLAKIEGRLP